MENRKPKDTEDILEFVKSKWKLTIQEFDVLERVLDILQLSYKKEIQKYNNSLAQEENKLYISRIEIKEK